jgi:hypothetical protein
MPIGNGEQGPGADQEVGPDARASSRLFRLTRRLYRCIGNDQVRVEGLTAETPITFTYSADTAPTPDVDLRAELSRCGRAESDKFSVERYRERVGSALRFASLTGRRAGAVSDGRSHIRPFHLLPRRVRLASRGCRSGPSARLGLEKSAGQFGFFFVGF